MAEVTDQEDGAFVPIRADDFVSGSKSAFDVFVRIAAGKYLKLLQAGDNFTPERLQTYLSKGVKFFYIKREAQEQYLRYQERLSGALLKSEKFSGEVKLDQMLGQGTEMMSFLKHQGVTQENLTYATKFVSNVRELVGQIVPKKNHDMLGKFFSSVAGHDHGVGTSLLAGVLAHVVEIRMDRPVQIVGMASLFHDIGMANLPEELWHEDESKMDEAQRAIYRTHPQLGAEVLKSIPGIDSAAIQAVEQHHMRVGEKGFPSRSDVGPQTKVAELIGICEEFNRMIREVGAENQSGLLPELEKRVLPGFSRQIVYAFRTAFFPAKKT